jgi:NADP-dependent 3-hydroxy acid dehydrogenase YdfG
MTGLAVIAGVGPGLGASLSRKFSKQYTVVLLARSQGTLDTVSAEIKKGGGEVFPFHLFLIYQAIGFPTDILDEASMKKVSTSN